MIMLYLDTINVDGDYEMPKTNAWRDLVPYAYFQISEV